MPLLKNFANPKNAKAKQYEKSVHANIKTTSEAALPDITNTPARSLNG